ncbi:MAG: hypothetical protein HFJ65_03335 [Eggerthellaceae bacterium]|nr:hypothetical protein [Eggerthellaceae bacterium]
MSETNLEHYFGTAKQVAEIVAGMCNMVADCPGLGRTCPLDGTELCTAMELPVEASPVYIASPNRMCEFLEQEYAHRPDGMSL